MLLIEFWDARIRAADPPIRPAQTRIPEVPDQTEFLKSWYDYNRGYRIEKREDGTEHRIAMLGEPLCDVALGHLPRNLLDLRANAARTIPLGTIAEAQGTWHGAFSTHHAPVGVSEPASNNRESRQINLGATPSEMMPTNVLRPHHNLQVLNGVSGARENGQTPAGQHENQARRIGILRRELQRMRIGIERVMAGLNELGELLPDSQDAIQRSTNLDQRLESIQHRLIATSNSALQVGSQGAPNHPSSDARSAGITPAQRLATDASQSNTSNGPPDQTLLDTLNCQLSLASADLEQARRTQDETSRIQQICEAGIQAAVARVRRLEQEKQILEQNTRIFGSREEVERLGPDYESPIANMFNRAYVWRARVQDEERRRHEPATGSAEGAMHDTETATHGAGIAAVQRALAEPDVTQNGGPTTHPGPGEGGRTDLERLISMQSRLYRALGDRYNELQADRLQEIHNTAGNFVAPPLTIAARTAILSDPWQFGGPSGGRARNRRELRPGHSVEVMPAVATGDNSRETRTEGRIRGLDDDDGRPAAKSDEEMTLKMECKVCYSQVADVAVIPCGHLVMCEVSYDLSWCCTTYLLSGHRYSGVLTSICLRRDMIKHDRAGSRTVRCAVRESGRR